MLTRAEGGSSTTPVAVQDIHVATNRKNCEREKKRLNLSFNFKGLIITIRAIVSEMPEMELRLD
jgi:hypothetical protein